MNHSDNDNSALIAGGGVVTFIVLAYLTVKMIGNFFLELSKTFDAFGKMVGAFIPMAWNCLQVVFLIALIFVAIATAVFFCVNYYKMVTAIKNAREQMLEEASHLYDQIATARSELEGLIQKNLGFVRQELADFDTRLTKALEKSDLLPPTELPNDTEDMTDIETENESDDSEESEDTNEEATVQMSNPY